MKNNRKAFWICLILALAALLQACQSSDVEQPTEEIGNTTATEGQVTEPVEPKTYLVENGACPYTIVYAADSSVAKDAAIALANKLYIKFKLTVTRYSSDDVAYDADAKEIYIGDTGFEESDLAMEALPLGQSVSISVVGSKIVFCATAEVLLEELMNTYLETLFPACTVFDRSTGKASVHVESYSNTKEGSQKKIELNGVDLSKFTIVYENEESGYLKEYAHFLRDSVRQTYLVDLPVCSDQTAPVEHEILIGNTNRSETRAFVEKNQVDYLEYDIGMQDDKLCIVGGGIYSVKRGVIRFVNKYLNSTSKEISLTEKDLLKREDMGAIVPHAEGSELRLMTYNLMTTHYSAFWFGDDTPGALERIEILQALLVAYTPDVIGVQEACADWRAALASSLDSEKWGICDPGKGSSNGETFMIYNKQTVRVVEVKNIDYPFYSYTSRIAYAEFEMISNPEKHFLFFNTHWAGNGHITDNDMAKVADQQMEFMSQLVKNTRAEKGNIAAFTTGDYNTLYDSVRYNAYMEKSGLTDTFLIAKKSGNAINEIGGFGQPGSDRTNTLLANAVDHIFCPAETKVWRYETVTKYRITDLSDHTPRYADVSW